MIIAAEALVAARGIGGVSAREVAKAANLRNNCSVQYHFGSMEELFQEVVRYRMAQLDELRGAMMARHGDAETADLKTLVRWVCIPHLAIQGCGYAAFLCQYLPAHHPAGFTWLMRDPVGDMPMIRRILTLLRRAVPGLPLDIFDRRITSATLLFLNTLQGLIRECGEEDLAENQILADALRQAVAVMRAPH